MRTLVLWSLWLLPAMGFSQIRKSAEPVLVLLPSGKVVCAEAAEELSSEQARPGDLVAFRIAADVSISHQVCIPKGAHAWAKVLEVKPTTYNLPERIRLELVFATAADGQVIALHGGYAEVAGPMPGMNARLREGKRIMAYVLDEVMVRVEGTRH